MGTAVPGVYSADELLKLLEKCILLYRDLGYAGERLGRCIERIGVDVFMAQLLSDDVLNRKEEILSAPLKTRA
jgi:dissimilatory sulfite reductase (desulfoviridin) alpha/beta subunit